MVKKKIEKSEKKQKQSGKGLSSYSAAYFTGIDHRSQVERSDVRFWKKKRRKSRRLLDRLLIEEDETALEDVPSDRPFPKSHSLDMRSEPWNREIE